MLKPIVVSLVATTLAPTLTLMSVMKVLWVSLLLGMFRVVLLSLLLTVVLLTLFLLVKQVSLLV